MGHGIFKLQCFLLYKRHVFPTDNHATKEHTCLYSIFLLTNTDFRATKKLKVSALLSPPAASGSKDDSFQYSYTHEKNNIYDLSPELKHAPLFGNTSVCHENSYGKLHLIANDNMHCMPRYHSKTDFPIWYVMD